MTDKFLMSKFFEEIKNRSNNIIFLMSWSRNKINKLCNVYLLIKKDGFSYTIDVEYTPDEILF